MRTPRFSTGFALLCLAAGILLGLPESRRTTVAAPAHPNVLFLAGDVAGIRARAAHPTLAPVASRLMARAETLLKAAPIQVSTTGRGEADRPGTSKGWTRRAVSRAAC